MRAGGFLLNARPSPIPGLGDPAIRTPHGLSITLSLIANPALPKNFWSSAGP